MAEPGLLPYNRTPWEAAMEAANAARYPLPVELVAATWSPDDCPADLLPYLAWAMSVDVWDDAWPELTKREVIRKALTLHRLKTTVAGIKAHVALTGATVTRVIRPPAKTFMRGAMTEEARLAWLDTLPQIRIYPFATKSVAHSRTFFNGKGVRKQFYRGQTHDAQALPLLAGASEVLSGNDYTAEAGGTLFGHSWMRASRGSAIYGRRATFYDRGVETAITLTGLEGGAVERVTLVATRRHRAFLGHAHYGADYAQASKAEFGVVTIRGNIDGQAFAVEGGVEPIDVRPKRIAQQRTAPAPRAFFGRRGGYMRASYAPLLIYDRIALNDPERLGARRKVRGWHGHGRFGMPPFTAEFRISVPMKRGKRRAARWMGVGFLKAPDMTPLDKAIQAVRVSKAFRDTVLIDTATHGRVQFGGGLRFGEFTFGQVKEVV
jgi:phage tail P2-like protein